MPKVHFENKEIAQALNLPINDIEFTLDEWGNVDCFFLENEILILMEIEKGQKHPNTNVLKVWPYLEKYPNLKMVLIQLIHPANKAPKNRLKLCVFTGQKLEKLFPDRFRFIHRPWNPEYARAINGQIKNRIATIT